MNGVFAGVGDPSDSKNFLLKRDVGIEIDSEKLEEDETADFEDI